MDRWEARVTSNQYWLQRDQISWWMNAEVSFIVCGYSWPHSFSVAKIACKGNKELPQRTPTSKPPEPTPPMTPKRLPSPPLPETPKNSTCGPSYYDLLLIASWDRMPLLLKDGRESQDTRCRPIVVGSVFVGWICDSRSPEFIYT